MRTNMNLNHFDHAMHGPVPMALRDPLTLEPDARPARCMHMRRAHLANGVDPQCLRTPAGSFLWFVSFVLDRDIHAGCLGFTRHLYQYAIGATENEAMEAVRLHMSSAYPGVVMVTCSARRSCMKHPEELVFPQEVRRLGAAPSSDSATRTRTLASRHDVLDRLAAITALIMAAAVLCVGLIVSYQ
jgi:hypothetical protein